MTDLKPITHRDFSHPWAGFDMGNLLAVFGVNVMVALVMAVTHYLGSPKEFSSFVIAHIVTTILTFTWLAGLTARDNRRASYRKYLQGQALFDLRAAQECPQVYAGENLTLIQEAIEEKESIIALQREAAALQAAPRHQNARSSYSQKHSSENGMSTDAVLTTSAGHSSSSSSYCDSGSSSSCGGGDGGGGGGF